METILVVDDEEQIRQTMRGVLADEGYAVAEAADGRSALDLIERSRPHLAVVDIWMPGLDGIELVSAIRERVPGLPVIVMSGHGNIEAAMRVAQLGASHFLEKPFTLEALLGSVARALGRPRAAAEAAQPAANGHIALVAPATTPPGAVRRQRTIGQDATATGLGLHTGVRTGLILQPAPPGSGIVIGNISSGETVPALVEWVESTDYATTLRRGGMTARTIEHLMAALHAYGITNVFVKIQGEVPILDGAAVEFCDLLDRAGIVEGDADVVECIVDRRYAVGSGAPGEKLLAIEPADRLIVDYTLSYPEPVGEQRYVFHLNGPESFRAEIAGARTFGFVREIAALEAKGLAGGGRLNNCVLIGDDGIVNAPLRYPEEFARHKILDILGDVYLLGRPIRGRITARRTGHRDNIALVRELRDALERGAGGRPAAA
jgi:UDP-3-O-acyl N-acetylglucosamine deacetylase